MPNLAQTECWHQCPRCDAEHVHLVKDTTSLDEFFQLCPDCKERAHVTVRLPIPNVNPTEPTEKKNHAPQINVRAVGDASDPRVAGKKLEGEFPETNGGDGGIFTHEVGSTGCVWKMAPREEYFRSDVRILCAGDVR